MQTEQTIASADGQESTPHQLPSFLFLGPDKSGSTWIYNFLNHHDDVYMVAGKGLYYFSSHFDRGEEWYLGYFRQCGDARVRGEVSHNYLSSPEACSRIHKLNPAVKMMVCLREPAGRAFSAYLHALKNGRYAEGTSFEEALEVDPTLVDHGRYATQLKPYFDTFPSEQLYVTVFDDLGDGPQSFADGICDFLEIPRMSLTNKLASKMMPAGVPRTKTLVKTAKRCSKLFRSMGLRRLRGRIKTTRWIRNLLYVPYAAEGMPRMHQATEERLKVLFRKEVLALDDRLDLGLARRWGYRKGDK